MKKTDDCNMNYFQQCCKWQSKIQKRVAANLSAKLKVNLLVKRFDKVLKTYSDCKTINSKILIRTDC